MAIVSLEMARRHTRSIGVQDDDDLALKILAAEALVLQHLRRTDETSPPWTAETDPETDREFAIAQAAVLKVLGNLYRYRGDDETPMNPMSEDVIAMLSMQRDPTLS